MKIGFLSSLRSGTGNNQTAERISNYLRLNYDVILVDINKFSNNNDFNKWDKENNISLYYGIHAYRSGQYLLSLKIKKPYLIIFGGTDINEYINNEDKLELMKKVCNEASYLICFSKIIKNHAKIYFNNNISKLIIINPSIPCINHQKSLQSSKNYFNLLSYNSFRDKYNINTNDILCILPCGIRPVKDPLYICQYFIDNYNKTNNMNYYLLIIGPILDSEYYNTLFDIINNNNCIIYHPNVPQQVLHGIMLECDALVNSSKSEGLANILLEAMHLKIPIIARDIEGNRNIIKHEYNGYLYKTLNQFDNIIKNIKDSTTLQIISNATKYINENHIEEIESKQYINITKKLI